MNATETMDMDHDTLMEKASLKLCCAVFRTTGGVPAGDWNAEDEALIDDMTRALASIPMTRWNEALVFAEAKDFSGFYAFVYKVRDATYIRLVCSNTLTSDPTKITRPVLVDRLNQAKTAHGVDSADYRFAVSAIRAFDAATDAARKPAGRASKPVKAPKVPSKPIVNITRVQPAQRATQDTLKTMWGW